ncbi:MAG: putative DNA-binding domain-containing protein [Phycisphaerae bacterium]|nr:putative DNA-binding domain-containing protein [Phycisphaerae bacterium]
MRNRSRETSDLRTIQDFAAAAIMRPLDHDWKSQRGWPDGRAADEVVSKFIKPNARLSSFERIEIYNRQYWFRLFDCLHDDFPGLRAILGEERFEKLALAYLKEYPSRSFTLRNLGSQLRKFVREHPELSHPRSAMAGDMVDFEWAQVVAFDGLATPPIEPLELSARDPETVRLDLQPNLTLLDMAYPLDEFLMGVKRRDAALRSEASNAISEKRTTRRHRVVLPRRKRIRLAVHRYDNTIFLKHLTAPAFATLSALRGGQTLIDAIDAGSAAGRITARTIREWFQEWGELGWLVEREDK